MSSTSSYIFNTVNGALYNWSDVNNEEFHWNSILIGNGASINVWDKFNYPSIYSHASSIESKTPLDAKDVNLFRILDTHNFEQILTSLKTASIINRALGLPDSEIIQRYDSIKKSLAGTISEIHIPWIITPDSVIATIRTEIQNFKKVYTTNYDLLICWSIMYQDNPAPFTDYFFAEEFDSSDTNLYDEAKTRIFYLHGALHLYRLPNGTTLKRKSDKNELMTRKNLLDLFGKPYPGHLDAVPLLVSEGAPDDKLMSINQSDYLTFAFNKFAEDKEDIVVFGHSLNDSDVHIVKAMSKSRGRRIAIALLPDTPTAIRTRQAELIAKFPESKLYFFDSTTHPLGFPSQKVTPKEPV